MFPAGAVEALSQDGEESAVGVYHRQPYACLIGHRSPLSDSPYPCSGEGAPRSNPSCDGTSRMIRAGSARRPPRESGSPVFHKQMAHKCVIRPYPDVHTGRGRRGQTLAHFRDSSLVSARDPSLPRVARFFLPGHPEPAGDNRSMSHDHGHLPATDADARRLGAAFALIVAFMAAEVVAGIVGSSLALLSDAGHMLTDAIALGLALRRAAAGGSAAGRQLHLRAEARGDPLGAGQRRHPAAARHLDRLRGHPAADRAAGRRGGARPDRRDRRHRGEPRRRPR